MINRIRHYGYPRRGRTVDQEGQPEMEEVDVVGGVDADGATKRVTKDVGDSTGGLANGTAGRSGEHPVALSVPLEPSEPQLLMAAERGAHPQSTAVAMTYLPESLAYRHLGKPLLDRIGALILGAVALPIVAIIAVVIRMMMGSPVLYIQERVGWQGKRFRMYKFRTMRLDQRREQRPFPGVDRRVRHKTLEDPRHTAVGRFLRRRSLDELPQLWNVVLGDMSLVGPRPELPSVVARYGRWQHDRHLCKPGLTGLWQISARNHGDGSLMCEHTEIDLEYLRAISLRTDLMILRKTLGVLGGGE